MNKILLKKYVWLLSQVKGARIWKQFLQENGIYSSSIPTSYYDEIVNNSFKETFGISNKEQTIQLQNISKTYENGFKAVDNFNLEIKPKDFVCLLGPSGCGKTTALRMMAGLDQISGGKYIMGSKEMNTVHPSDRKTAMVFQNYALYPYMNVYNNIAFGLKLKTYKNDVFIGKINEIVNLKKCNLDLIKDKKFEIKTLKNPLQPELNDLKIKLKKAKINQEFPIVEKLSNEITKLKSEIENKKGANVNKISELESEISTLKNQQKEFYANSKLQALKNNEEISQKVKKLEDENFSYFEKKKELLPELESSLKAIRVDQKNLFKSQTAQLKVKLSEIKKAKKEDVESLELESKKLQDAFKIAVEELSAREMDVVQKIEVIKNYNKFNIAELEGAKTSTNSLIEQAVRMAVIWKRSIPSRVNTFASIVGLTNFLKRKPAALSGGQRQRVALIRAISKDAQLFLFDEPLSNLDAKLRGAMRTEIKKIHQATGATTLYVTHDQIEAMTMANKVVVMNVGYIQQVGHPKDLYDNPANLFVARFIGTPTINSLPAVIRGGKIMFGSKELPVNYEGEKLKLFKATKSENVVVGIRAQDITVKSVSKTSVKSINGSVEMIELIGAEYILTIRSDIGVVKAIVPASSTFNIGDLVELQVDQSKVHLFDRKTGISITSIVNEETKAAQIVWENGVNERIANKMLLEKESKEKVKVTSLAIKSVKTLVSDSEKNEAIKSKIAKKTKKYDDYNLVELDEDSKGIAS